MSINFLTSLDGYSPRRVAACIRQRLQDIETALARGFTHRQIREQLNREGIVLTEAYYNRLIPRLRREARSRLGPAAAPTARDGSSRTAPVQADAAPESVTPAGTKQDLPASAKRADLSPAIDQQARSRPRTISTHKPNGPKFKWDPKGAEKIDPNKM